MALGVLNNLSAIYAENNLNKTSASLQTVLQQLSSGSRINSGADDAAGLSLVNGLNVNSTALTQSKTNSAEGVGLLQVADGALSQVTSMLDRAITLATEASNGTLNSTQLNAANQEYQSLLSELTNIGATTTYNNEQVFGSTFDVYVGDGTTNGATIDALTIGALSSSSVGDSNGLMSYTSGLSSGDVFIDLGSTSATTADTLNSSGKTNLVMLSLSGSTVNTTTITVGSGTSYANTAAGMISAINASGLGVTASFTTDKIADSGTTGDYGIEISGSVGVGNVSDTSTDTSLPSTSSYKGVLTTTDYSTSTGTSTSSDYISGSLTLQVGTGTASTISISQVASAAGISSANVTLSDLVSYINTDTALGVTATINTSSDGSVTLRTTGSTAALKITSGLYDNTVTGSGSALSMSYTATPAYLVGIDNNSVDNATYGLVDSSQSQTSNATATMGANVSTDVATISYTDSAGEDLSATDLKTQADAQSALTKLSSAVSYVSAMDGYIGAQINVLNTISSVVTTQQENITSAQDAIQATDFASTTSNMSKYEVLSQTGIAALAQANTVQQEVTKLLQ